MRPQQTRARLRAVQLAGALGNSRGRLAIMLATRRIVSLRSYKAHLGPCNNKTYFILFRQKASRLNSSSLQFPTLAESLGYFSFQEPKSRGFETHHPRSWVHLKPLVSGGVRREERAHEHELCSPPCLRCL